MIDIWKIYVIISLIMLAISITIGGFLHKKHPDEEFYVIFPVIISLMWPFLLMMAPFFALFSLGKYLGRNK